MTNRRNLTPPAATPTEGDAGTHLMRRGGARREVSTRVFLRDAKGATLEGWALNVSRGGVRAILEEKVELGQEFDIEVGTDDGTARKGRIVWMQEEPDGVIVGVEFTGLSGTHKSAPPPAGSEIDIAAKSAAGAEDAEDPDDAVDSSSEEDAQD